MRFSPTRPDRAALAQVPFGDAWLELDDEGATGDRFSVRGRMAMYRSLVERGNPSGALGVHDQRSPFWGYASQLAWQHRSGRLAPDASDRIDPASWWGACNYALSVIPHLAMVGPGVGAGASDADLATYATALHLWRTAIQLMTALPVGADLEPLRFAVWRAHLESIETAVRVHHAAFVAMPFAERRFAAGWVRMVDLFGAAALRTDLERMVEQGAGALPSRILTARRAAADEDLDRAERSTVRRVGALADRPAWRWRLEMRVWRRVMRTRAARDESEVLLGALLGRGGALSPARVRALAYGALPVSLGTRIAALSRRAWPSPA